MDRFSQICLLLLWLTAPGLLASCAQSEVAVLPVALAPTTTPQATPTLVAALATAGSQQEVAVTDEGAGLVEGHNLTTAGEPPATATATPTSTPAITPTSTLLPAERMALGQSNLYYEDYAAAVEHLSIALDGGEALAPAQQAQALYDLGLAYLGGNHFSDAVATFEQLLAQAEPAPAASYFHLGQAHEGLGDHQAAIDAYRAYLEANPDMAAYVNPVIAAAYLALGDRASAVAAYEAALNGPAHRLTQVENRQRLAAFYLEDQDYAAAIAQYDAIRDIAVTENTQGQMTYLAGAAELLAGNTEAAYARYLDAVNSYPRAYESYLGLVALVNAGQAVDEFQRGLVNYHARSYEPCAAALNRYVTANPESYRADSHLYLAWCHEGLGNLEAALAELDNYARTNTAEATVERARLQARAGNQPAAIESYLAYVDAYPDGNQAAFAAWWAAVLTERQGDQATAADRYQAMADAYNWHEDAPEALFRAGWLRYRSNDTEAAIATWRQAMDTYPNHDFGAAALVWLLRALPAEVAAPATTAPAITASAVVTGTTEPADDLAALLATVQRRAASNRGAGYYALRARDMVEGLDPFAPPDQFNIPQDERAAQAEAEAWLRTRLDLEPGTDVGKLGAALAGDRRLVVGEKLWHLGMWEMAKRELEALRQDVARDALLSYQLALFFRDLGLYRSSIIAATSVLAQTGTTAFSAPRFIGRLAYPVYYADLIVPQAGQYGFDPLLQFSLVRQESLFESFARSGAAAQGLSQVIPDTGAWIAQRLAWPNYHNDDLYKPYVGLAFGAYYLDQQLRAFDGHVHAALSAYNAGPGNAARWHNTAGGDHDLYLETVNFAETRLYIERIYSGYVMYRYLYGE